MNTADKNIGTEEVSFYVYREGALLIVLSKTDSDFYDVPSWFIRGDVRPEMTERLFTEYFEKVTVTQLERIDKNNYVCYVTRDSLTKEENKSISFVTRHSIMDPTHKFTPRAKNALDSLQ